MSREPHVAAVCGSLAPESTTRTALRAVLAAAEGAGAETTLVDLREYDLPPRGPDRDAGDAPAVRHQVADADAVVLGTPVYHGSYSSPLKTALDYCGFDEFEETTVGLVATAGGSFPTSALAHLREVARTLTAWTLPTEVAIPNAGETVGEDAVVDESVADRLADLGEAAVAYANVEQYPTVADESRETRVLSGD
ncbi:NADPH-dependent FMN reductase [Halobaculum sp. MBLA0147]|uniref:NADPH-dependent FMN reductase n=1 Tax=Halobaculum sp. MBLA0147 TaxID=3079934 RepID=UPI0035241BF1